MIYHFHDGDQGQWYRFETNGEQITLVVAAAQITEWKKWCASDLGKEITGSIAQDHKLSPFKDENFSWGFGGCGRYDGEHSEDWDRLTMPLPVMEFNSDNANTLAGYNASFSLEMLLLFLDQHSKAACKWPQGLAVGMGTDRHRVVYGGVIWADISPALAQWCRDHLTDDMIWEIDRAMKQAAAKIWNSKSSPTDSLFRSTGFRISRDTPYLSCGFGGTLGVNGSDEVVEGKAYRLSPHNTDGPLTQLVMLTGLAKLDEFFQARR